jgi:putative sterol carrier protein
MAVEFGTVHVYEEMARRLNGDPVWAEKGKAINYTMVYKFQAPVDKAFLVRFEEGQINEVAEYGLDDHPKADFVISGPPTVWRGIFSKEVSPTAALTRGQLKLEGKMTQLLKHMSAFSYVIDAMTEIELV